MTQFRFVYEINGEKEYGKWRNAKDYVINDIRFIGVFNCLPGERIYIEYR